ncbi:uncharacterized protein A4U43_C08F8500 [Asparagus officinalis]|nr:uncharacterized protein A4U43_C08F8500 [Asparagus officinalis]
MRCSAGRKRFRTGHVRGCPTHSNLGRAFDEAEKAPPLELTLEEVVRIQAQATEIAAQLAGSRTITTQAEMAEKKKSLNKVGSQGHKKTVGAATEASASSAI